MAKMWPTSDSDEAMTYSEQIRHPSGALDPPREVKQPGVSRLWLFVIVGIVVLVIIGKFRPQWLAKIGIAVSDGATAIGNPLGWV